MDIRDNIRRDGRVWGRGTELKTILSQVTVIEMYRIHIKDFGWVDYNGWKPGQIPLNTEIYINLAKNGKVWLFVDYVTI